jgi:hypothetical protein
MNICKAKAMIPKTAAHLNGDKLIIPGTGTSKAGVEVQSSMKQCKTGRCHCCGAGIRIDTLCKKVMRAFR